MADPYIGEIRMFAGTFAPAGWAFCDGSLLPISEYDALFNLLGTTYGGDGQQTFALPDLRGRAMVGTGTGPGLSSYVLGQQGGVEQVTLTVAQLPSHGLPVTTESRTRTHPQAGSALATGGAYAASPDTTMAPVGGGQPHENMPPFLAVGFIIALFGIFPPRP
jgi:microcystin-dependent protein